MSGQWGWLEGGSLLKGPVLVECPIDGSSLSGVLYETTGELLAFLEGASSG